MLSKAISGMAMGLVFLSHVMASAAWAQSFNCRNARLPDEVAICQNDELAELDSELAREYFGKLGYYRTKGDWHTVRALKETQRDWLRIRHSCGYDADCIRRWMFHRFRELAGY